MHTRGHGEGLKEKGVPRSGGKVPEKLKEVDSGGLGVEAPCDRG